MQGVEPAVQATWGFALAVLGFQPGLGVLHGERHRSGPEVLGTEGSPRHPSFLGPGGGCNWLCPTDLETFVWGFTAYCYSLPENLN